MEDRQIIQLYNARSEEAISETKTKYGAYINTVAYNILRVHEDAEECEQDTYIRTWNSIPPHMPEVLRAYLGKLARNLALDMYRKAHAEKRGEGSVALCLDELGEIASGETQLEAGEIAEVINSYLEGLEPKYRKIFVRRYFYMDPVKDIAERYGYSESKVKTALFRMRGELKKHLADEGIQL